MRAIYPFSGISDMHLQSTFGCGRVLVRCRYSICAIISSEGLDYFFFFCLEASVVVKKNMQKKSFLWHVLCNL